MPAEPNPEFTINGQPITESVAVAAGDPIVCEIVDINGVSPVAWSVVSTDDTKVFSDYSFAQSGSVGQTYTGTALENGTAGVVECLVAGIPHLLVRGKFYVPTDDGQEVLTALEQNESNNVSSAAFGMIKPTNEHIRSGGMQIVASQVAAGGTETFWTFPLEEDSTLGVRIRFNAWDTVSGDAMYAETYGAWKRVSAAAPVVILPGRIDEILFRDDASWTFFANVTGNSARFQFSGDASNIVKFKASIEPAYFKPS
jgi:hypothetical protein